MKGRTALFLTVFGLFAATVLSTCAQGAQSEYEYVSVSFSTDMNVVDQYGVRLRGMEAIINPLPTGSEVEATFTITSRDTDTDIDHINISYTGNARVDDISGLSGIESGGQGDWQVVEWPRAITYSAVTDRPDIEQDDALDRWESLTISVVIAPQDAGFVHLFLTLSDTEGGAGIVERTYSYPFFALGEGESVLMAMIESAKCNLMISRGTDRIGMDGADNLVENFPQAVSHSTYLTDLYLFLGMEDKDIKRLWYTVSNPSTKIENEYRLRVYTYTFSGITSLEPFTVEMTRTEEFFAQDRLTVKGAEDPSVHQYLHASRVGYYLNDLDDDDDGFEDSYEVAKKTDPHDPNSFPVVSSGSPSSGGSDPGDDPATIALLLLLAMGVGVGGFLFIVMTGRQDLEP